MFNLLFGVKPRKSILLVLSICCFFHLSAQGQSAKEIYEQEAIYLKWNSYIKNGEQYSIGLMGKKLLKELEVSEAAMEEGRKYKKNRNLSLVLSLAGLGGMITGLATEEDAFLWGGLVVSAVAIPFSFNSVNNMHKAIWLRNRDILR